MVMGVPLLPVATGNPDGLDYRGVFPASRLQVNTGGTVLPPRINGIPARPEIRWYAPRRVDSDSIVLRPGDDLHLYLAVPPSSSTWESWTFNLNGQGGQVSSIRLGPLPTTITVPAGLIPPGAGSFWGATVTHSAIWGDNRNDPGPNADYVVEVHVQTQMYWKVRIVDP